jgi:hypothetical protein
MSSPSASDVLNLANFVILGCTGEYQIAKVTIPQDIYVLTPIIDGITGGYVEPRNFREIYNEQIPVFRSSPPVATPPPVATSPPSTGASPPSSGTAPSAPLIATGITTGITGWKLYLPGEEIHNISIEEEKDCSGTIHNVNTPLTTIPDSENCIIYAESSESPHDPIMIKDESVFTIKLCKKTNLDDIFKLLTEAQKRNNEPTTPKIKTPIILITFISNDSPNMMFEKFESKSILTEFEELYRIEKPTDKLPTSQPIESPLKISPNVDKTEPLTTSEINENVEEFKKTLKTILDKHPDANKLQIFNEKTNKFPIKVKTYANSDFIIFKLVGNEFREINANNPEENAVGNAILTFFKYSKTSISYNNTKATIKCSLTYKKNDVPLYLKMGNDYYKLRKRK